jgi:hypothetical protein
VDHVAALAEGRESGIRVVGRIEIPVSCCQDDMGPASAADYINARPNPDPAPPPIAPAAGLGVPPAAIAEVVDHLRVRSPTALAAALRPAKADRHRQLAPVDWVEESVLGPERHGVTRNPMECSTLQRA